MSPSPSSAEGWGVSVRKRAYPWKVSVCKRTRTLLTTGLDCPESYSVQKLRYELKHIIFPSNNPDSCLNLPFLPR